MATTIVKVTADEVQATLEEGVANCVQLDRNAALLKEQMNWQSFGTIGFEAYREWLLNGQPYNPNMFG